MPHSVKTIRPKLPVTLRKVDSSIVYGGAMSSAREPVRMSPATTAMRCGFLHFLQKSPEFVRRVAAGDRHRFGDR